MGWPLSQDYNEAVQAPRASFADPDLRAGEVVPGPMGLPLPRSGNFADVYQVRAADGRTWAVKCFTRPVAGLDERYAKIDRHLQEARLPFTVGFRFLSEGIKVRGQWYPVLKMEWVEGFTLNEFVRQQLGRADMLRALLGMWVRLCKRLRDARIAHADLQHGNVLLVPGETANKLKLRLIDYDGMWVPALSGKPSGEAGHPAYQHPARLKDRLYSADVDRFPHLVIGCALPAVAVAGKPLFHQFDNGDNLLFREADLAQPAKSKLFRALWDLDDPTVTNLVALLVMSAQRPLKDTPWLDQVLEGEKAEPVRPAVLDRAAAVLGVPARAARRAAPAAQIYSVPEEANAFANLLDDDGRPRPLLRRRRKVPVIPLVAGGGVVAAAGAPGAATTPEPRPGSSVGSATRR
jgi:serine/threonine protein kinase